MIGTWTKASSSHQVMLGTGEALDLHGTAVLKASSLSRTDARLDDSLLCLSFRHSFVIGKLGFSFSLTVSSSPIIQRKKKADWFAPSGPRGGEVGTN